MKLKRILMTILGVCFGAVSVGFFKLAAFGVDPFQVTMSGIDKVFTLDFGTLYVIVNACLLVFSLIFDRHYIGLGTLINLFLTGYIADFSLGVLESIFPEASIAVRISCLVFGFVAICFASSVYMTADMGVSTYDAVALILTNKWHLGKFKYIRIITDLVCVILGVLLLVLGGENWGGVLEEAGIGTIITAFFMGPLIDFFNRKVAVPFLNKGKKEVAENA